MPGTAPADKTTIFDEEISRLENRRAEVESERHKLLAGQITVAGPDGSSLMNINLGALSTTVSDQKTVERNLRQTLLENPLVPVLDNSFKKTRELREEMTFRGDFPPSGALSPFGKLIRANTHSNQFVRGKNVQLGNVLASPWLLAVGIAILLVWCGGPLLYTISGGAIGGKGLGTNVPVTPSLTPGRSTSPNPQTATPTRSTPAIGASSKQVENFAYSSSSLNVHVQLESLFKQAIAATTATPTPEPTTTTNQVGSQPSDAGGLNGPHGAFLAPSRMTIPALSVDTPVTRAITQINPNDNSSESLVIWPRPREVVHTGAYPGEMGNMLIMGNQADLGALRRIQQNDEVTVYDRKGNAFIYRILAFSANGQTEREVDPTSVDDAWVFAPTQEAILTILVTYPQPLPAVDPNQTGNNQVTPRDDYLVQKKLAYRGVLAMYAPATVKPAGTPVSVPQSAWQTVSAPVQQPATTTSSTTPGPGSPSTSKKDASTGSSGNPTPAPTTPGIVIPSGAPATGDGGGSKPNLKAGRYSDK